ncbi:MAG: hypothetical protein RMH97_01955 [Verrucomicrobiales bacterium]|nr:hypothetical protein [Verrucomicrobiales bacterium]
MDKITLITRSIRCFVLGLIGLVPVLGLPFAISAWVYGVVTARKATGRFNPAARYLLLGRVLGLVGFLVSVFIFLMNWYVKANAGRLLPRDGSTCAECRVGEPWSQLFVSFRALQRCGPPIHGGEPGSYDLCVEKPRYAS